MSKTGFMQRPLWISAAAITDAYTVNTFSASYLDTAGRGVLEVFNNDGTYLAHTWQWIDGNSARFEDTQGTRLIGFSINDYRN